MNSGAFNATTGEYIENWESPQGFRQVVTNSQSVRDAMFGDEKGLVVRFKAQPTPVFLDTPDGESVVREVRHVEHCVIKPLFDRFTVWDQPVRPKDKLRFARQYADWKANRQEKVGIPLEAWEYQLGESELLTCKVLGYNFVHELAQMPDDQVEISNVPGMHKIRAMARASIAELFRKEDAAELQEKFDRQQKEIDQLRDELEQMHHIREVREREAMRFEEKEDAALMALGENDPFVRAKRGRPRKND